MSPPETAATSAWDLGGQRLQWLVVALLAAIALLNALPHLGEPIWQDEGATLVYAGEGARYSLAHYTATNNHMAFSAMLSLWLAVVPTDDVAWLRLLPLGFFLLSVPVVFASAKRLGGTGAAVLGALLFGGASVSGNFATQLRGYAPSWLFVSLSLLCALHILGSRRHRAWQAGYALATLLAVATVPTNVFLVESVGASVAMSLLLDARNRHPGGWIAAALLLFTPPLALILAYARVWDELMAASDLVGSGWTRADLLRAWWHGTMSDYRWLWAAAVVGMGLVALRLRRRDPDPRLPSMRECLLPSFLLAGLPVAVAVFPSAPFPRSLVPYLPVWYCGVACLAIHLLRPFFRTRVAMLGLAALAALGLGISHASEAPICRGQRGSGNPYEYDLCHQYFRDQYHPEQVLAAWAELRLPQVPIATNYEGYFALRALGSPAQLFEYRHPPSRVNTLPLVVAHDEAEMRRIRDSLGLHQVGYQLAADTGWFKVYAPRGR